jgi:glycosyltransferase involved in cell wall biosynthesis
MLKNTSLCAIVRDEVSNRGGGLEKWLRGVLPFMEEAVVVDTGSIDGSLTLLYSLAAQFPKLKVYERKFDGFPSSRNYALSKVETTRALVLDADEEIREEDFEKLAKFVEENPKHGYNFTFLTLFPRGHGATNNASAMIIRLFNVDFFECVTYTAPKISGGGELLWGEKIVPKSENYDDVMHTPVEITHHVHSLRVLNRKRSKWYKNDVFLTESPLVVGKRDGWK